MHTKTGVSVLIFNKLGQILVGKRKGSHGEGMLSVPGGHIEFFEDANVTCDRELLEEIGVNFPNQYEPIGFSEDFFHEPVKKHYITLYYAVNGVDSDVVEIKNMEPEKCESWDWVNLSDLPNNMFCDTHNKIFEYAKVRYPEVSLISTESLKTRLASTIRDVPNFPKEGILFKDITPLLADGDLSTKVIDALVEKYKNQNLDAIAGIESRGFFFGFALAARLGIPFIPIRKAGKLPFKTVGYEYALEYGTAKIEMNADAIAEGMNVLIHDDLLATGGTAVAAAELITGQGGNIAGFTFIITLAHLGGYEKLNRYSNNIYELISY